ncbi:Nucleoporin nup84 [Coemansia javaensis]|uniref:Nuclear pore complex protein n=1 Tax=Coemansia javaensis TaxID=2761396 RepID=A0A9W8LDT9_9FUNG|nr:Nucleoporin nup84 [Coemansia javaensis]
MAAPDMAAEFAAALEAQAASPGAFARLARERRKAVEASSDAFGAGSERHAREAALWRAEDNTWALLERLYPLRQQARADADAGAGEDARMDGAAETATDFTSVQELMAISSQLAEYVEVRRWLEATAPAFQPVETRKGHLFYTRRQIRDRARVPGSGSERTVTEADPDATSRQRKELAPEDAEYEAGLLRTLFDYVRRGSMVSAMDLCVESDEPWRAASLKGGLFWRDPALEPEPEPEAGPEAEVPAGGEGAGDVRPAHAAGNINRALWKCACAALAHDESNDTYERALYAALSGRLDEVILVCETWEDYVWAYVNTMIEARIDQQIQSAAAGLYVPAQTASFDHVQSKYPPVGDMRHVFAAIATHDSAVLRSESSEPFRRLQTALITDSFADYIAEYARALGAQDEDGVDGSRQLLRFVVHAALCLRGLGVELPADAVHGVLEAYVAVLARDHRDLVAAYVAHMPADAQTEAYAAFLQTALDDAPARMRLLGLAGRHGLDQDAIAKRAAELALCAAADEAQMDTAESDSFVLAEPAEPITQGELDQIRAIEWVVGGPHLYGHALVETCGLARRFLLAGRPNAAARLFNSLPDDFVQQEWVARAQGAAAASEGEGRPGAAALDDDGGETSHFHEYIHLLSLCDALAYYSTWAETLYRQPAGAGRRQAQWLEWKGAVAAATERAEQMFRERLLEVDWLGPQSLFLAAGGGSAETQRAAELARLREMYIPEAVFRLHSVLFDSRAAAPQNLQRSLDLAQLVADESLGIYRLLEKPAPAHPHGQLPAFLALMRQSAFEILRAQQEAQPDGLPLLADDGDQAPGPVSPPRLSA